MKASEKPNEYLKASCANPLGADDSRALARPLHYDGRAGDSPEKATGRRVRVAVEGWVLRPEQEGQDSGGAGSQRVTDDHQAVVHRALVLPERHKRHSRGRSKPRRPHTMASRVAYQVSSEGLRQDHFRL